MVYSNTNKKRKMTQLLSLWKLLPKTCMDLVYEFDGTYKDKYNEVINKIKQKRQLSWWVAYYWHLEGDCLWADNDHTVNFYEMDDEEYNAWCSKMSDAIMDNIQTVYKMPTPTPTTQSKYATFYDFVVDCKKKNDKRKNIHYEIKPFEDLYTKPYLMPMGQLHCGYYKDEDDQIFIQVERAFVMTLAVVCGYNCDCYDSWSDRWWGDGNTGRAMDEETRENFRLSEL